MLDTTFLEAQVLGSILIDPSVFPDIAAMLPKHMFRLQKNRQIYRMMLALRERNIDISLENIAIHFTKHMESIGNVSYLSEIMGSVPTPRLVFDHAMKLIEFNARMEAVQVFEEFKERFMDPSSGEFGETLDELEQRTLAIRPKTIREDRAIENVIEWYEDLVAKTNDPKRAYGLLTGWGELDRMTLGFQRSDFIVVGARTSMGKSAFALEVAKRANSRGYKVALFSLEMMIAQVYSRLISNLAMIRLQAIRVGNLHEGQLTRISGFLDQIRKIHLDDTRGITADYITSEMRRLKRQEGLDLVIIDYLQEIKEPNERNDNAGSGLHRVCQKIRAAAKECDCAVIGLSQVKREVEVRQNKRPMTSDLSGSTGIEAVADAIILLYRDEYYNPDTSDRGIIEVNLAKQRNGPTGIIKMNYDKEYQKITSKEENAFEPMALL